MISRKHKKVCATLNYIWHFPIVISTITGCVSMSAFASWVGIPLEISISTIRLNICVITAGTKKYKSISKKKKKKHDRIVLLSKSKLNSMEVLISTALIHLVISHDECVLINNVLKEYNKMEEEMKFLNSSWKMLVYL